MNASEFLGKLPNVSRHSEKGDLTLFGAGFYSRKKVYWTFGANLHHDTNLAVSRDVAEILADKRTGVYDVKSLGMDNSGYFDAFVGSAFNIGKYLTLGVRAKFLIGIRMPIFVSISYLQRWLMAPMRLHLLASGV